MTVVSENGMLADALSTALYLMGQERAVAYWEEYGEDFELILVRDDGEICVTEGIVEGFQTEREYAVIRR